MAMIVSISGSIASGKSSTAKKLASILNWERIYVGGIRRELAQSKGMSLEELNKYAITHPETDVDVDKLASQKAKQLLASGKNVLIEGRVQFHFLPESFKIFISCNHKEAAKRIYKELQENPTGSRSQESDARSLKEIEQEIKAREANDKKRFKEYYDLDHTDPSHYDLLIDSSSRSQKQVTELILKAIKKQLH